MLMILSKNMTDYVREEYAFYDQRYALLKTDFDIYYGGEYNVGSSTYDRVHIWAKFAPTMVWNDEQPLYAYEVGQSFCPQTEEELNRIISAVLAANGPPDKVMETGPNNRFLSRIDSVSRGRDRHYIWRLNSTGPTKFNGNPGYIFHEYGPRFYDDLVFTLVHRDIKNWQEDNCGSYIHKRKLQLYLTDELYDARRVHLNNAHIKAGFPVSEQTRRLIEASRARRAQSGN